MNNLQRNNITFYQDSQQVTECNPSFCFLHFLYFSRLGRVLRRFMRQRWVARLSGFFYNSRLSRYRIQPFITKHKVRMGDFVTPLGGYRSFNEFFTRSLKPNTRHIDLAESRCVSPVDGKVLVITNITPTSAFYVKQTQCNLEQFFGSVTLAQQYMGGTLMIFRLAPYDYHRIHFPIDCVPSKPTVIHGIFESVNPVAFKAGVQPLLTNERHLITLATKQFDTVAMVLVGAMLVGTIVETYQPEIFHKKGSECGYFAFGGSTVVLAFKPGILTPCIRFIQHSLQGLETAVQMGVVINE